MHTFHRNFFCFDDLTPWLGLQCVIVVYPDHTHLLFGSHDSFVSTYNMMAILIFLFCFVLIFYVPVNNFSVTPTRLPWLNYRSLKKLFHYAIFQKFLTFSLYINGL